MLVIITEPREASTVAAAVVAGGRAVGAATEQMHVPVGDNCSVLVRVRWGGLVNG